MQIHSLVPTRTLVQIRTHAQKYFMRHAPPAQRAGGAGAGDADGDVDFSFGADEGAGGASSAPSSASAASASSAVAPSNVVSIGGVDLRPIATIRHVALEPMQPADPLGIDFQVDVATTAAAQGRNHVSVAGFTILPATGASGPSAQLSVAEESDLVRIGDVVLGVSGVALMGLSVLQVQRAVAAARTVTLGGIVVLHLGPPGVVIGEGLVEEVAVQCAGAAVQLLGSRQAVETVQQAVAFALAHPEVSLSVPRAAAAAGVGAFAR